MIPVFLVAIVLLAAPPSRAEEEGFLSEERKPSPHPAMGGNPKQQVLVRMEEERESAGEGGEQLPPSEIKNRGIFRMREVRTDSDWDCDPTAIPAWCRQFQLRLGLNAKWMNPRQPVTLDSEEIFEIPMLYMTGHNAFSFSEHDVQSLRRYLLNGGVLWVDDCLYGFPFGRSFKSEIRRVLPEYAFEPILPTFKGLNSFFGLHYQIRANESGMPEGGGYKQGVPVQVIRIQGQVAVLYTPYDLGCHAEISSPPTAANPLGGPMHSLFQSWREDSYRLSTNIVLFLLTH
ncbi:MAG: DUF4159 domain-containing protein [Planctomycetes bacterium]|nr:DUF4159 domain-containing protein [Planctomycetota bacterium]